MSLLRSFLLRETFPAVLLPSAAGLLGLLLTLGLGAGIGGEARIGSQTMCATGKKNRYRER